jgi:hypothetical protein
VSSSSLPPGWPPAVRPPGAPDWQRSAVGWLLDQCPPEYRGHPVLLRHPVALVVLAGHHTDAGLQACRRALATARSELADDLPQTAMAELIEVLEVEQARMIATRRSVGLVEQALRGHRYVPRL